MIQFTVYNPRQHQQFCFDGLTSFSRHEHGDWNLLDPTDSHGVTDSIRLLADSDGCEVAIECDGVQCLDCAASVPRGSRMPLNDHLHLVAGDTHFEISSNQAESSGRRALVPLDSAEFQEQRGKQHGGPAPATLGRWLEALGRLHRWSANRPEFFRDAARFVVDPVGLDGALLLRRDNESWNIVSSYLPHPEFGVAFNPSIVEQVAQAGRTMFHTGAGAGESLVLSPIACTDGEVTGMVYGYRAMHHKNGRRGIRYLEAQLVELLADSVRCSIQRLDMETEAARTRVTYEQAFAPTVASQVELDAATLKGREQEVTVLFADLRGFATLCERLSTPDTYLLLNDVMDALTAAVMQHGGTLIDYYGDGLAAMWNAPLEQQQHALLACQAALAMQQAMPGVSDRWQHVLDCPLRIGIGVDTGRAQVGNIGSSLRLKYGPRGAVVNMASRLEQATKRLNTPVVASRKVVQLLAGKLLDYRICQAELPGIEQPVDVFAICSATSNRAVLDAISHYEDALTQFEAGDLDRARESLEEILHNEVPTRFLIDQIDREHHRRLGRRAGDEPNVKTMPAIPLGNK